MSNSLPEAVAGHTAGVPGGSPAVFGVRALREERGLTQLEFGARIGLANKASVSLLESGKTAPSLDVALEIERLSAIDGVPRIDAADLCESVRKARAACAGGCGADPVHAADGTAPAADPATGQAGDLSGVRERAA
jgi:DNA-binding XRE family transcriptional regulator